MHLRTTLYVALALIACGPSVVHSQPGVAGRTQDSQEKEINVTCPQRIQIGPVNLGKEWESQLNTWVDFRFAQVSTDSATKEQLIGCWYGDANRPVAIGQKAPPGFSCTAGGITVTCKKRPRIRTND